MHAALVGVHRQLDNIAARRQGRNGEKGEHDWQLHIEGAMGEAVIAKWLNLYWSGSVGDLGSADVGKYQVRTTSYANGSLILHPWDLDDAIYFLVVGKNGAYSVPGFVRGRDGKRKEFWRDPTNSGRAAYFVPRSALTSPQQISEVMTHEMAGSPGRSGGSGHRPDNRQPVGR